MTVINPDGPSTSLPNAFTVELSGDGTLGDWQSTSALNVARSALASAHAGNSIYALGGATNFTQVLNSVERAVVNPDGTLGAWQVLTATMTTQRQSFGAVAAHGYLYAIGGYRNTSPYYLNSVERAPIQADGTLGAWQPLTATLNVARTGFGVIATDRFIYVVGGYYQSPQPCTNSVERAAIQADGTLGMWEVLPAWLNTSRDGLALIQVGGNLYAVGGNNCGVNSALNTVEEAAINVDGSLSVWHTLATTLTVARTSLVGVQGGGYLYAIGGYQTYPAGSLSSGTFLDSVDRAEINPDGSLGGWQALGSTLNISREYAAAAYVGNSIYTFGGYNDTSLELRSVERAVVSPPSLFAFSPSVVPNTSSSQVTVWGTNLAGTASLRLPDNTPLPTTIGAGSTLTATIPAGLTPGWYTVTVTLHNGASATQPYLFKVMNPPVFSHRTFLPLATGPGTVVCGNYFDDFSSDYSGWPIGNDGWVLSDYWNGEYRLLSETAGYIFSYSAPTCRRQNYVVEADARWADAAGDGYGLAFGITPNWQQYYVFYVSSDQQSYGLYRLDADNWTTLVNWTPRSEIHPSPASNHLKVTRNGTQIKLEVNGVALKTLNDGAGTAVTKAGLFVASYSNAPAADGRFDNFRITALAGASSMQGASQAEGAAPATDSTVASHRVSIPNNLALPAPSGK